MDLTLNPDQQQIVDAAEEILRRFAGHERAKRLIDANQYDFELHEKLAEAGFMDIARGDGTGPLEAALVADAVARAGGIVAYGAGALVAPMVLGRNVTGPVALARKPGTMPLRFGPHARTVLIDAGDEAMELACDAGDWAPVDNFNAGYPLARLRAEALKRARPLGRGSGDRLRNWWRCAIAVETAATMQACIDTTVKYVNERVQFGRALGSFQSVQHRLAESTVYAAGSRWLALEAVAKGAPASMAATAAAYAADNAWPVFRDVHQFHGAMGFTREYHLHVWSMRLRPLLTEMGGAAAHQQEAADLRFNEQEIAAQKKLFSLTEMAD
ncbi:MAG: acyl-CoA dehydrogenase family protein [Gammaproteobacteria bacterium]